ncbi:MAG: sigma-70 family RNA polymerase sigma factor [Actinomycetota bacterium]|nr:sigma-70 family RNA polymerase sigma factor [Actinomycetota bacterium]
MDSDDALIERSRRGDLRAFETLVERHRDVVFRVAARVVGPDDANDVTQDAFLRAFHRLSSFRAEASFRAWLLQITHHAALTTLQRRRRDPVDPEAVVEEVPETLSVERQPAERLQARERQQRLALKLHGMHPTYRSLVVLRDLEGLSYEEIAEVLEMPLGSVKGRLHRARGQLIELLRANTYDWELPE